MRLLHTSVGVRRLPVRLLGGDSAAIEWGRFLAIVVVIGWTVSPVIGFLGSLSLMTAVGFLTAFFGFARPQLGAIGVTLVCTLDPLTRHFLLTGDGLLRWNTFNYALLLVMSASVLFVVRVADPHSRILKCLIALLAIELVFSPSLEDGVQHLLSLVTLFGLLVYFVQAGDDPDLWYMVGLVNGLAGAVGCLFFFLMKSSLPIEMNANAFAFFPETALFCVCFGFIHAGRYRHGHLVLGSLAIMNFVWVFLSGSRGGMLIATTCLLFVVFRMRSTTQRVVHVIAALVIAMVASSVFADLESRSLRRLNKLFDEEQSAAARTSGRSDLARAGFHMFTLHPLGVGTGGFAPTWAGLGFLPGLSGFKRGQEFPAHSGWIKILAENGWPGFLLLVLYVGSFAFCGLRSSKPGSAALGLLVTATLSSAFLSTEFQGKGFWLLAAGATAMLHPAEMARCMREDVRRFGSRPRRVLRPAA